ncbi:MAG: NmrA/HSCARG family protein [Vicinamibacterales bacterium]
MTRGRDEVRTIAVTGVTGTQGGSAAGRLLADGWHVRGLTRDASTDAARRTASTGVELVEGDMSNPAALDRLMTGAYGVYAVTDFFHNGLAREVVQGCLVADAAKRAGVRHFVFPSLALSELQTGVPYFEAKVSIERHIRETGLPATILRLAMFMEDLVDKKYAPPIWWGTVKRTVGANTPLLWIGAEDVGATVAAVFASPETTIGEVIPVIGDRRSIADARELFIRVTGKAPLAIPLPLWLCKRLINADLVPFWQWLGSHPADGDPSATRRIHPGVMDMETWLRRR